MSRDNLTKLSSLKGKKTVPKTAYIARWLEIWVLCTNKSYYTVLYCAATFSGNSLPAEGGFKQSDVCSCETPAVSPAPVSSVSDNADVQMSTVTLTDCIAARSTRRLLQ